MELLSIKITRCYAGNFLFSALAVIIPLTPPPKIWIDLTDMIFPLLLSLLLVGLQNLGIQVKPHTHLMTPCAYLAIYHG